MEQFYDVVKRVGYFRNRAKISARELSLRIGKHSSFITKMEHGEFGITMPVLFDIFEALDITCEEFFSDNFVTYRKDKEISTTISKLSDDNKAKVLDFMKNLK